MNERLIYVIGPSGAGKDSLLEWIKQHAAATCRIRSARRTITRAAQPGGERHEAVDVSIFASLKAAGKFSLDWEANGLAYGIRHCELAPLQQGTWTLLNGSRAYLDVARQKFPGLTAVHVTASTDTLQHRLAERRRESTEQIRARLSRHAAFEPPRGIIEICNDGSLEQAGADFLNILERLPGWAASPPAPGEQTANLATNDHDVMASPQTGFSTRARR